MKNASPLVSAQALGFDFYWIYKTWSSGTLEDHATGGQNHVALPLSFVPKNTKTKHQITNKSQISSTKLQIPCPRPLKRDIHSAWTRKKLKFQYSMAKTFQDKTLFGFSYFGHWNLFDIWDLTFGISISQWNSKKANPLWG
jgi:hypothetical protein